MLRIHNAEGHGGHAGTVGFGEAHGVVAWLLVQQVVDVALPVQRHGLAAVPCHGGEAHPTEQHMQLLRLRMGVFHEGEAIGAHRVVLVDGRAWCVVRKRTHLMLPCLGPTEDYPQRRATCVQSRCHPP
jgi:hypothetical protein